MPLLAQVAAVLTLVGGEAATPVRNPSREAVTVTVALVRDAATADRVGDPVRALISPARFTLAQGESQLVRLRLKEPFPPGTLLRAVWTFTPIDAVAPAPGSETAAVARIVIVTRFVSKVRVP